MDESEEAGDNALLGWEAMLPEACWRAGRGSATPEVERSSDSSTSVILSALKISHTSQLFAVHMLMHSKPLQCLTQPCSNLLCVFGLALDLKTNQDSTPQKALM